MNCPARDEPILVGVYKTNDYLLEPLRKELCDEFNGRL